MESSNKLGEVWEECRKCCPWGELAIVELGAFKHLYVFQQNNSMQSQTKS